jgi:hypothetical protein
MYILWTATSLTSHFSFFTVPSGGLVAAALPEDVSSSMIEELAVSSSLLFGSWPWLSGSFGAPSFFKLGIGRKVHGMCWKFKDKMRNLAHNEYKSIPQTIFFFAHKTVHQPTSMRNDIRTYSTCTNVEHHHSKIYSTMTISTDHSIHWLPKGPLTNNWVFNIFIHLGMELTIG